MIYAVQYCLAHINRGVKTGLLFLLLGTSVGSVFATAGDMVAEEYYTDGVTLFEHGEYEAAANAFERAIAADPDSSRYHHWLAKAYGGVAELSGWMRAYGLAHRIREALERAVELDGNNRSAIEDLAAFHERAPALVGGNPEKAEMLRALLAGLKDTGSEDT